MPQDKDFEAGASAEARRHAEPAAPTDRSSTEVGDEAAAHREKKEEHGGAAAPDDEADADFNHDAIEREFPHHELDVELGKSRNLEDLEKIETRHSQKSRVTLRSKISRVFTGASRTQDAIKYDPIPEMNLDEGIVGWDGQDDPTMPLNFPEWQKWTIMGVISAMTFITPFASSILSPGISILMKEFDEDNEIVGSMTVSIYLLGYVIGPLLMAPLSEIYGRKVVIGVANAFFCVWQIGCALAPSISSLIVFRFLSGVGGAGVLTLGGGVISDIFYPHQRGFAMGIWTLGPLCGPTVGPLIGGFVAANIGWRWDFWIVLIIGVVLTVLLEVLNKETYPRILIQRKVERLQKELGRDDLRSCYSMNEAPQSLFRMLRNGLVRPFKLLFLSPIVFCITIYIGFEYGVMYLLYTTIPTVFEEQYGFSIGLSGLVYLSMGFGNMCGWAVVTFLSDKTVLRLAKANGGVFVPEMRLPNSIAFGIFLPITFFWYGWCAYYKTHWATALFSLIPFGFGIVGLFLPLMTCTFCSFMSYLVDCYPLYAASVIAANTVFRSLVGALLPLAGPTMYQTLGLGWGNSLLGFLSIAMIPFPLLFYKYGSKLRSRELKL